MAAFPVKHLSVGGDDPFLPDLLAAINYSTEICIAAAFIRGTGFELIQEALTDALKREAKVRILTGDYLNIIPITLILWSSCLLKLSLSALLILQVAHYLSAINALLLRIFSTQF